MYFVKISTVKWSFAARMIFSIWYESRCDFISAIFALWDCIINVKIKVSYIGEYFLCWEKIRGFCSYMINLPLNVFELKFDVNFVDLVQWLQVRNVVWVLFDYLWLSNNMIIDELMWIFDVDLMIKNNDFDRVMLFMDWVLFGKYWFYWCFEWLMRCK